MATELATLPELSAVSPIRGIQAEINGDEKALGAVDGAAFGELVDLGVTAGSVEDLTLDTVMLHTDPAEDLGVGVGDRLDATFVNGVTSSLEVVGIYDDASLAGNWLISLDTLEQVSTQPPRDFFVLAKLADGVEPAVGRAAIESVLTELPADAAAGSGRVPARPGGPDRPVADDHLHPARLRDHDRRARHRHHAGAVGVRADP